ncbi:SGNH/GDSL hydrolase family protein [Candidatus Daviesbacteria bacterium]|nr:SGNH/GDSL hydrolase family protein [Candidatus Daviesbacteria bacterium]
MKFKLYSVILAILIALEIIIIYNLGRKIQIKFFPFKSVTVMSKKDLIFKTDGDLNYFYEPKPNSHKSTQPKWLPYKAEYSINSDSLNERFEYAQEKPANTFRIVTLGDSFTYGLHVNTKDNYSEKLEDLLNTKLKCNNIKKFEVLNLGMMGYDVRFAVERFKSRGQKYNPDLVIWILKYDDFDEISEVSQDLMKKYLKQPPSTADVWEFIHKKLMDEYGTKKVYEYQEKALSLINRYYKNDLLIFSFNQLYKSHYIDNEKIIKNFISSRPKTYLYIMNYLKNNELLPDSHPNVNGHLTIAQNLFNYLLQNILLNCNS